MTKIIYENRTAIFSFVAASVIAGALSVNAQTNTPPPPKWDGTVASGLTLTSGNSDTLLFTLTGRAEKKWEQNELSLGADASYGESDGEKNNETLRGFGQFNRLFGDRWYAYMRLEALHDGIADIDYRITLSPGAGYYFIKEKRTSLSAEVGPGFVYEKEGDDTHTYATLRLGEKFGHKLNDRARIFQSAEILPQVNEFDNYIVNAEAGVEADITKTWSLRFVIQDSYDNKPASDRKKNDLKLIAGVGWKF